MAKDFFIPKLGDNVDKVTIVNWLVEDGAQVQDGDEIVEVETDKAVVPIPANGQGYLHIGPYKAGDVVPIMTVIATISEKEETFAPGEDRAADTVAGREEARGEEVGREETRGEEAKVESQAPAASVPPADGNGARIAEQAGPAHLETQPKVTPVAQKMAADMGVDLRAIAGSGDHDRITKSDILGATAPAETAAVVEPAAPSQPSSQPQPEADVLQRVPLKGIRGIIAKRMAESVHTTARVTLVTEVDATELVALRERLKAKFSDEWGFAPGYNDLLALIVANALHKFPSMNARLSAAGDAIEHLAAIRIGMAVDTERGLLVTVIREADTKGLQQFGTEFRAMVDRARAGKSTPEDLSGGTFTITNLGMYRVDAFTPIINLPEAAILGVGRIVPKPVVKGEEIVIRKMLTLSLVFDHRLSDGAPAARFLDYICELIEEPYLLFLTQR